MEKVQKIIETIYLKVKNIEKNNPSLGIKASEILKDTYASLTTDNPDFYRLPANVWLEYLYPEIERLKTLNDVDFYNQVIWKFENSIFSSLRKMNQRNVSSKFGNEMEKIYYDPDTIVGIHGTQASDEVIENEFFENGVFCNHGPRIDCTFNMQDGDNLPYDRFLAYLYSAYGVERGVIVCIPRDMVDVPMWKELDGKYYLTPSYIYGYYVSHDGLVFNENPEIVHNPNYGKKITEGYNLCDKTLLENYSNSKMSL